MAQREIKTPCGKTIYVGNQNGKRIYTFSDGTQWDTGLVHRVELQIAILDNDTEKYKEQTENDK